MTRARLLAEMDSRELTAWQVFFRIESERREDEKQRGQLEEWVGGR